MLPITLSLGTMSRKELGLVDSGGDVSILPYDAGLQLGLNWNSQPPIPPLGGILAGVPVRGAILDGRVHTFPTVRLAFAWVQKNDLPLILGQMNFFLEFDCAFYRYRAVFRIEPRTP
jgi:hypothetical protein